MALRKWAGYIALHPVTVCTDHQSLQLWHKGHVDTGGQVGLVKAGLLPPECLTDSQKPVRLKVANSQYMVGGTKEAATAVGLHLVHPDRWFVLRTNASDYAVGAVLEQVLDDGRHVPVAFWSRVLAEGQRRT